MLGSTNRYFSLADHLHDVERLLQLGHLALDDLGLLPGPAQLVLKLEALLHLVIQEGCKKQDKSESWLSHDDKSWNVRLFCLYHRKTNCSTC